MWFLEPNTAENINSAEKNNFKPSAEQLIQFDALSFGASQDRIDRIMSVAGDTAEIKVNGILTNSPNIMAMIFGGGNTIYSDIISAIASAEQNSDVKNIVLAVDSPGGNVDGLFATLNAIASTSKPIKSLVINKALSAAYAIVAQTDEIIATNEATHVGSIGTVVNIPVDVNEVTITSTKAPKKAPDVTTDKGKEMVVEQLDAFHDAFVATIAMGRSVTPDVVNREFGQGSVVLATDARKRGMIDSISNAVVTSSTGPAITEGFDSNAQASGVLAKDKNSAKIKKIDEKEREVAMDLKELQANHPSVFAEAFEVGVKKERDRVEAHLKMGDASGDMPTAIKAINDGSDMTQSILATYQAAGMNREAIKAVGDDAPGDLGTDVGDGAGVDAGDEVAGQVEAMMGTKKTA